MHTVPAIGQRRPRAATSGQAGRGPRDAVRVAERHQPEGGLAVGDVPVAVGHAGAGRHPLDQGQPGASASWPGRSQRGAPPGRVDTPYRPPPNRTRSSREPGTVSAAAVLAMCLTSGVTPAFSACAAASANASSWAAIDGCPGRSAQAKCDHRPATRSAPAAWAARAASTSAGPVRAGGSAAAQPGIGLEVQPGRDPGAGRRVGRTRPSVRGRAGGDVDARADGVGGFADGHQAQHRGGDPGRPQRQRLGQVGGAEPARAAGQRGPGRGDHAVPVPVRLDHGHHLAAADMLPQRRDVAADRGQVDDRLPVHDARSCRRHAADGGRQRGDDVVGADRGLARLRLARDAPRARPGTARPPAAASRAARPCR